MKDCLLALLVYNLVLPILFILYLPVFVAKLVRRGGFTHHFWERFGIFSGTQKAVLRALDRPVWIHAVSVGEVVAAAGFIRRWKEHSIDVPFVLSTTTTTGHDMARKKLPEGVPLIYCPIDFWFSVSRVLRLVTPRMLVIFEVEIWPNLVSMANRRGIPVALVNGRMSDTSARGYARHRWFFRPLFERFRLFCVQSEADAERIRRVTSSTETPVHVCGTMKFDQAPPPQAEDKGTILLDAFGEGDHLVWTVGSTHSGEEALVADVFLSLRQEVPDLKMVLVPRHHERTSEVQSVLESKGLSYRLLVPRGDTPAAMESVDVLLVNTTGELMGFYSACDIAYVGKSLAGNEGGHNIIEPAIFGKAVVHGAHMENFRLVADLFRREKATVEVEEDSHLLPAMRDLCRDAARRRDLGARARAVVDKC
ncbi:MAG: 3-deoxy-D-manno-octulosonic acid transferase, partial [Candidatus Pacebacteria bacterium]|nr:3-deoxy-D-manno-octulosonic acid transferase [Candidatus Paceibacterota bacterium]